MGAEHLVIVGKGGVGKSTTSANLAAALAETGKRVLLIGYDARRDSTARLRGKEELSPLPGWSGPGEQPLYCPGLGKVLAVEAGPMEQRKEGEMLLAHPLLAGFDADFIIHDLSRAPGPSSPLPARVEGVARLLVVTSSDMAAIQVVNELFAWLNTLQAAEVRFGGLIANKVSGPLGQSIIADFASQTGSAVIASVTHSLMASVSDFYNQTLMEAAPLSHISFAYRKLARQVVERREARRPAFLQQHALREWGTRWGDILAELETGVVKEGGSI